MKSPLRQWKSIECNNDDILWGTLFLRATNFVNRAKRRVFENNFHETTLVENMQCHSVIPYNKRGLVRTTGHATHGDMMDDHLAEERFCVGSTQKGFHTYKEF